MPRLSLERASLRRNLAETNGLAALNFMFFTMSRS
jgi:hypothetical protein